MHMLMFAFMNWKVVVAVVGVLAALGGAAMIYSNIKDSGRQEERRRIERETNDATSRANEAETAVRRCYAAGGMWDHAANRCSRPQ